MVGCGIGGENLEAGLDGGSGGGLSGDSFGGVFAGSGCGGGVGIESFRLHRGQSADVPALRELTLSF
jgi:hypothetical protein